MEERDPLGGGWVALEGKSVSQSKKKGHPWGVKVFTIPLWTRLSLSVANFWRKWKLSLLVLWSIVLCHKSDTMWSGRNAETCYGCVRGRIYTKLEVLSFEMARREIERVIVIDYITKFSELYSQKYLARESAKNQTLLLQGKGRVMLPNQMSLQKNSKRPSTPPSFSENYVANFLW